MSRRIAAPRIGVILVTLVGIALASAGLATAVTMSVSAPVRAEAELVITGGDAPGSVPSSVEPSPSAAWKPMPVDTAGSRSITDLTDGASTRVTVDVLGMAVSPGQAGALVATILSLPLVIAVAVLVAAPRSRRWWSGLRRRQRG